MMIHHFLSSSAQKSPDAPLVIHKSERASYGDLERASNQIARLLLDGGLKRGDRLGLLQPNSIGYVASYYGALKAGAVVVPLHAATDARALRRLLGDCEATGLIAAAGALERIEKASEELPLLRLVVLPRAEAEAIRLPAHIRRLPRERAGELPGDSAPAVTGIDLDREMIIYTSGSTGRPRGAVLSHLNIVANTRSILQYLELTAEDRVLQLLPFPYVYGKSLLNTHVAVGGALVIHDSLVFPDTALDAMEREGVTGLSGVPSTFAMLLNRSSLARRRIPSLRYVTQAGGGMPRPHLARLIEALPGVRIFVMYGATEAGARLCWLEPEMLGRKLGSIGRAIPNVEIVIRRDDGSEAGAGETGEIVARGSNIMEGYWGDRDATEEVLDQHGFHTGDLGYRDEDGYLWVVGRKREMIKSGAHRVSPREIEEVLLEHPDIEEAAVIGLPDEYLGETIEAYVTVRPSSSPQPEEIRTFCQDRLVAHKMPHHVHVCPALPRNMSGKLDKRALRDSALEARK